jgi:hypothetical protein
VARVGLRTGVVGDKNGVPHGCEGEPFQSCINAKPDGDSCVCVHIIPPQLDASMAPRHKQNTPFSIACARETGSEYRLRMFLTLQTNYAAFERTDR